MSKYELLQWKFTACQYNIEDSNGFNTFSMSKGLTTDDKADLCRKAGSYTPPDGLPFTPTSEEIAELFPVAFSSFPLRSGKHAVVRTVYVGQSYAETRWGNFFSHALILPSDRQSFYPIQLFNSPLFKSGLTEEELQIKTIPPLLPSIEVEEDYLHDFSSELPQFLGDDTSRPKTLMLLINAIRNGRQSGKPLILKDLPDNIPLWLAAIQYAFPLRLARGITFTTYVHSLTHGERFHITTTSDDKTIPVNSATLTSTNHVFDFAHEKFPVIPVKDNIYVNEIKCNQMCYPGNTIQDMMPFIQSLHCEISDNSLDKAVLLYKFQKWNTPVPSDSPLILENVLDFCFQQDLSVKNEFTREILQKNLVYDAGTLALLLPRLMTVVQMSKKDSELLNLFRLFFVRQFEKNIDEKLTSEYCKHRFELLDIFLSKNEQIGKNLIEYVHDLLKRTNDPRKYAFLYYALILCLYNRDCVAFTERIKFLNLERRDLEIFFDATLDFAISKAVLPEIHEQILALYARTNSGKLGFLVNKYINRLYFYELNRIKDGIDAKPQGLAFIAYFLKLPDKVRTEEWGLSAIQPHIFVLDKPPSNNNFFIKIEEKTKKTVFINVKHQLKSKGWKISSNAEDHLRKNVIKYKTFLEKSWEKIKSVCEGIKDVIANIWKPVLIVVGILVLILALVVVVWKILDYFEVLSWFSSLWEYLFSNPPDSDTQQ